MHETQSEWILLLIKMCLRPQIFFISDERFITFWADWDDNVNNPAANIRFIPKRIYYLCWFFQLASENNESKKKANANIPFLFFNCRYARNDMIKLLITKNKHHDVAGERERERQWTAESGEMGDWIREKKSEFGEREREGEGGETKHGTTQTKDHKPQENLRSFYSLQQPQIRRQREF